MAWKRSGAHGGEGGVAFSNDLTQVVRLAGFNIRFASWIDAIQPVFTICGGEQVSGGWHGGGGGREERFIFAPDETILHVSGRSGVYVDSLTIITTKKKYGPFGGGGGDPFDEMGLDEVGGFLGRSQLYLDKIGFFRPC